MASRNAVQQWLWFLQLRSPVVATRPHLRVRPRLPRDHPPTTSAPSISAKLSVDSTDKPLTSAACATIDGESTMSFETPDQPQSLLTVKVADGAVKDVIWQAGNTLHSWGSDYFGRDPLVSVDADRWRIEASVREISGDGAAELKAMEIQAEIDCTSDESHHRDDPYQSVANGQYAPSPERKAQLEPLDALFAKTQSEVIIDGQAATVTKTSCDPSFVAKTNVRADLEIGGESASLSWDFTDPAVPKAVELRLTGNQLGWQHEKTSYPHTGSRAKPTHCAARSIPMTCPKPAPSSPSFSAKQKYGHIVLGTYCCSIAGKTPVLAIMTSMLRRRGTSSRGKAWRCSHSPRRYLENRCGLRVLSSDVRKSFWRS